MNCEKVISRKNLTKEEWLVYRRSGIGGSDAGAIAGLNPYSTAYSVYLDKLGEAEPITETEAMRQGMELEEYVAKRFCEHTGKRVKRCEYILRSKAHPFMLADVDRLVVGENAVLECKTTLNRDGYITLGAVFSQRGSGYIFNKTCGSVGERDGEKSHRRAHLF